MNTESTTEYSIFEQEEIPFEHATTGQRFVNFLIDSIVVYALFFGVIFILAMFSPTFANMLINSDNDTGSKLMVQLVAVIVMVLAYVLIEGLFKGKSLGKLITKTRAVQEDGHNLITWKQVFLRSISRVVPFETLSGFSGHPWHDKWSKTIVVKNR